jgi:hypothetical protein
VFRTYEIRPGWVPPILRGDGVLPISVGSLTGTCRFTAASPVPRLLHSAGGGHHYEACGDSPAFTRPVFPSPAAAGRNSSCFGFYPGLRTPRLPATHAKAGTARMDTGPGYVFNNGTSKQRNHSQRATSRRTPALVVTVTDHQPAAVLVQLAGDLGDVGRPPRPAAPRPASAWHLPGRSHRSMTTAPSHRGQPDQGLR